MIPVGGEVQLPQQLVVPPPAGTNVSFDARNVPPIAVQTLVPSIEGKNPPQSRSNHPISENEDEESGEIGVELLPPEFASSEFIAHLIGDSTTVQVEVPSETSAALAYQETTDLLAPVEESEDSFEPEIHHELGDDVAGERASLSLLV